MLKILVVGNINWFNLREMHIKPLQARGYSISVLSDVLPVHTSYIDGVNFFHLNKPKITLSSLVGWLIQAFTLLRNPRKLNAIQYRRINFLFKNSLRYHKQIQDICKAEKFDVIHCHFITRPACVAVFSSKTDIPIITSVHGSDIYISPNYSLSDLSYIKQCFKKSKFITVPGTSEAKKCRQYGCNDNKLKSNPWGVDPSNFHLPCNPEDQKKLKIKWNFFDKKIILSVRNLNSVYNIASIIDSFAMLENRQDKLLLIAGEGICRTQLEQQVIKLGVTDSVIFLGSVPHHKLRELYRLSDVYIQNPESDALPYSLLEALASGTLVVCGELGSINDINKSVSASINSKIFYSKPGTLKTRELSKLLEDSLANGLRLYGENQDGNALFNHIVKNYSKASHNNRLEQIYQMAIK